MGSGSGTEARWFLDALFGDAVSAEALIAVWTLPDKKTQFFDATERAADYATSRAADSDVYFGCGLYRPGVEFGRGTAADVVAITAVWGDVDYGEEGHKKPRPPTEDAAMAVLRSIGVKPSIVVHSGHGLHAYWLLSEPLTPEDGADVLARRWSNTIRAVGRPDGYEMDAVGDLARVLRVPGTLNRKGDVKAVAVLGDPTDASMRHHATDLEDWCVVDDYDVNDAMAVVTVDPLIPPLTADPPHDKHHALMANDPKYAKTYNYKRTDFADQSPSAYDFSLAQTAIQAGWSDSEVASLIMAFRRNNGHDVTKAQRRSYLQRTIGKAKAAQQTESAIANLERVTKSDADYDTGRARIMEHISKVLQLKVARWIQYGRDNGDYALILADNTEIPIGQVDAVISPQKFMARIYDAAGLVIQPVKREKWLKFIEKLALVREVLDANEPTPQAVLAEYLNRYMYESPPPPDDWRDALNENGPFVRDGRVHIHAGNLAFFLKTSGEQMDKDDLVKLLRKCGFEAKPETVRTDTGRVCRNYWSGKLTEDLSLRNSVITREIFRAQ